VKEVRTGPLRTHMSSLLVQLASYNVNGSIAATGGAAAAAGRPYGDRTGDVLNKSA